MPLVRSLQISKRLSEAIGSDPPAWEDNWQTQEANATASAIRHNGYEEVNEEDNSKAPRFPGTRGDVGDYVLRLTFWSKVKAQFPEKLDWPTIREQARNLLIQQGIKEIQEWLKKQSTDLLEDLLEDNFRRHP